MRDTRAGKTQRLEGEAFQARPQREVLAFDLPHRQFPYRVLRGREVPWISLENSGSSPLCRKAMEWIPGATTYFHHSL